MFTESSQASLERQQAANDCVFHETHHHVWYSSWNWSRHPNTVSNTDITAHFHHLIQTLTHTHLYQMNQGENANQKWYESLIQTSRLLWIRIRTSVLDSLPCLRQSFCQRHLSQAPPKQSALFFTCIIPAQPANCQFIWMASAFGMSATQPILGWL